MKFEKKPEVAEGVRWDGTVEGVQAIHDWADAVGLRVDDMKTTVRYNPTDIRVYLMINRKEFNLRSGDWLLFRKTRHGVDVLWVDDETVKTFYKPVDE